MVAKYIKIVELYITYSALPSLPPSLETKIKNLKKTQTKQREAKSGT